MTDSSLGKYQDSQRIESIRRVPECNRSIKNGDLIPIKGESENDDSCIPNMEVNHSPENEIPIKKEYEEMTLIMINETLEDDDGAEDCLPYLVDPLFIPLISR